MTHVLYIEASPRKQRSVSIDVARSALSAWQAMDSSLTIDTLDVWATELPEFDGPVMEAKYAGMAGRPLTVDQAAACAQIHQIAMRFLAANALVMAVPLWNFSIPYKLKHLIDVISQKDVLFTFDERGCALLGSPQSGRSWRKKRCLDPISTWPPGSMRELRHCCCETPATVAKQYWIRRWLGFDERRVGGPGLRHVHA